jgi:hypothetical protein
MRAIRSYLKFELGVLAVAAAGVLYAFWLRGGHVI